MVDINYMKLLLDDYLDTEEFGRIYHITVDFIKHYGEDYYGIILLPYCLPLEYFNLPEDEIDKFKVFDFLIYDDEYRGVLLESLKHFFRLEPVYDEHKFCIYIGNKIIDRNNFDALADIILKINKREKIKIEKPPVFENERQRDVYNKLMEGRKKKEQNNKITFPTVLNVIINYGGYYIPYEEISKMTIFKVLSRYEAITGMDYWEVNFRQALAGADSSKLDLSHWLKWAKL